MITPVPKNLVIKNTIFGILSAGIRLEKMGKKAPNEM